MVDPRKNPGIVEESGSPFLVPFYTLALAGVIAYIVFIYGLHFDDFSETELVQKSYYFMPALIFSLVGFVTRKKKKSLIYAIVAGVVGTALLVVFYEVFWGML